MCGICGVVGDIGEWELGVMTDALAHRGPDGRGVRSFAGDPPVALGHRRLAILDPTPAGAQPMGLADRWWITYNGEIYNSPQLKRDLEAQGERFETHCDTEVLLRLFALKGPAMLPELNGIFAFAIWDDATRRLFLARDRLGVKPLYHTRANGRFAFASELRALLPLLGDVAVDPRGVADVLTFLWVPDPRTAFEGVFKLPAGHSMTVDRDGARTEQWWDMAFAPEPRSEAEWTQAVREQVDRAVDRQMLSDVPVGSFLSGGIDSSAIVAAGTRRQPGLPTYTVAFSSEDLKYETVPDDLRYARRIGREFSTDYHERVLEADVLDLLPRTIWHLEEPVADPAAISTYLICREAGRDMPVMLSGVGGDEVFAGYPRHLAYRISRLADALPTWLTTTAERGLAPLARPGSPGRLRGPRRNLWKFMRAAGREPIDRYLSFLTYYDGDELHGTLSADLLRRLDGYDPLSRHREHLGRTGRYDELSTLLYLDAKTFLPSLNLTYTDKMSMAASVEVRVPLLDNEVVDLAARIPSDLKLHGLKRKYVFKRSQEGLVPDDVIWRPKAGFGAPVRSWLVKDLSPLVEDALSDDALLARGFVDPVAVRRLQQSNSAGHGDHSLQIYTLLCLELWCRQWIDGAWSFERLERESAAVPPVR